VLDGLGVACHDEAMTWTLTEDVEEFATVALPVLARHPVANTLVLTVTDFVRAGFSHSSEPPIFGWYGDRDRQVAGAVLMTPPFEMMLAQAPAAAMPGLVAALRERQVDVPGVLGDQAAVDGFAAAWTAGRPTGVETIRNQRLYKLGRLRELARPAAGTARLAEAVDQALLVEWLNAFYVEAHLPESDSDTVIASRIADNRVWLWVDPAGRPVSFAARQRPAEGVSRIGPVYTPPEDRWRGYGAAVTAACAADALRRDAHDVALFTDLANPTSNSIYQQIGFEPVSDSLVVRFVPRSGGSPSRSGSPSIDTGPEV
jgi:predicted GNAT family acetyltransferase